MSDNNKASKVSVEPTECQEISSKNSTLTKKTPSHNKTTTFEKIDETDVHHDENQEKANQIYQAILAIESKEMNKDDFNEMDLASIMKKNENRNKKRLNSFNSIVGSSEIEEKKFSKLVDFTRNLLDEINKNETHSISLRSQVKKLTKEQEGIQNSYQQLQKENSVMNNLCRALQKQKVEMKSQLISSQDRTDELQNHIQNSISDISSQLENYSLEIKKKEEDNNTLKEQISNFGQIQQLCDNMIEKEQQKCALLLNEKDKQIEIEKLQNTDLEKQLLMMMSIKESFQKEIANYQLKFKELHDSYQSNIDKFQSISDERQEVQEIINKLQIENLQLASEKGKIQKEFLFKNNEYEKTISRLTNQKTTLEKLCQKLHNENHQYKNKETLSLSSPSS